jgi:hypothetical protein
MGGVWLDPTSLSHRQVGTHLLGWLHVCGYWTVRYWDASLEVPKVTAAPPRLPLVVCERLGMATLVAKPVPSNAVAGDKRVWKSRRS